MITNPEQHDIDRAGKRLLRELLEPLKWVVNDIEEDYGIDCNIQVFDGEHPTGAWFHVQLKSSASSDYSANGKFVSQELPIDRARHYAMEMREPIILIHADVTSKRLYWHAPQSDGHLITVLSSSHAQSVTVRMPTTQHLPETAAELLATLNDLYLLLGSRELVAISAGSFAESLQRLPNQEGLHKAFQEKNDVLKLQHMYKLFHEKQFDGARTRADAMLVDPDSTIEVKFWAQTTLEAIDFSETLHSGKPQEELSRLILKHSKALQKLTARGPKYLKFYALISRQTAELEVLVHQNFGLFMTLKAHSQEHGNPFLALGAYAKRSANTRRIVTQYNRCVRLARYSVSYPDRWMLGRALAKIPSPLNS
ncbi:MAG: DUF4365 domain-containing protein [Candidatus Acidiferrales bacterium]